MSLFAGLLAYVVTGDVQTSIAVALVVMVLDFILGLLIAAAGDAS